MSSFPTAPARATSFTNWSTNYPGQPVPGNLLDAEFDRTNGAIAATLQALTVSLQGNGTLQSANLQAALDVLDYPGIGSNTVNLADAPSALSANLAQAWAEHLPDTIPPDVLAGSTVTGSHWSARWWANYAQQLITTQAQTFAAQLAVMWLYVNGTTAPGVLNLDGGTY